MPKSPLETPVDRSDLPQPSVEVDIGGLPYVLEAEVPENPGSFDMTARLPDAVWQELEPVVQQELDDNSWFARNYRSLQQGLHLGDGKVASVFVGEDRALDGTPSVYVARIQAESHYLPEDSEYRLADGTGSFVLDSLSAVADAKGWRIYLEPVERTGGNKNVELYDWYKRHGFRDMYEYGEEFRDHGGHGMVRLPQEPDLTPPKVSH